MSDFRSSWMQDFLTLTALGNETIQKTNLLETRSFAQKCQETQKDHVGIVCGDVVGKLAVNKFVGGKVNFTKM